MKILITGGAGFIGSNLAGFLLQKGHAVWALDNLITGSEKNIAPFKEDKQFSFIKADITSAFSLTKLQGLTFDVIYHLASPASPVQYDRYPLETLMANSVGTHNILKFAQSNPKTVVVFTSTSEVYGDPLEHPQQETYWGNVNSYGPRSCYDESKRFGEALCYTYVHKYNVDTRIVRLFNTYGPNMEKEDGRVISNFIVQTLSKKPITIHGDGSQTRSFCYISDMVKALYQSAIANISGEVINLGNPQELSIADIAQKIKSLTHSSSPIVFKKLPPDDPKRRKPNIEKAKQLLQWEPVVNLEEGLRYTIDYFKSRFAL